MPVSRDVKIGLARESSWGDGAAPQVMLPIEPPSITEPYEQILDNLYRGINAIDFGAYQGSGRTDASLAGLFYPEELGFLILAMMGAVSSAVAPLPYVHTFTMASQPPSLAVQEEGGVYPSDASDRRFVGMLPSSLTFTFSSSEGLLTWASDLTGKQGTAPGAGSIPSEAITAPFLGWHAALNIGGANARLIDLELTLEREAATRHGLDGTQFPAAVYSGGLAVTASMTFDAVDSTELDYVLDHETNAVVISLTYGAGVDLKAVEFTMTELNWGDAPAELDKSGIFITLGVSGRAIYNSTDSGPIKIILSNAREDYLVA